MNTAPDIYRYQKQSCLSKRDGYSVKSSEYKMGKYICQWKLFVIPISSYILHHTLQPCDHNIPLSADDNLKMTLGVRNRQRFIINIVICHKNPHNTLKLFVVAFFDNTGCFMMVDYSTVQHHFYGWNNWVTLASILDSDTFIEERRHIQVMPNLKVNDSTNKFFCLVQVFYFPKNTIRYLNIVYI